jgi:hypothetical protein
MRHASTVALDGEAFQLATLVPKLRDAAADVERKLDMRQSNDKLDHVHAAERGSMCEFDAKALPADGELKFDARVACGACWR